MVFKSLIIARRPCGGLPHKKSALPSFQTSRGQHRCGTSIPHIPLRLPLFFCILLEYALESWYSMSTL